MMPRHERANPDCPDCHGYGYIHVDDELVEKSYINQHIEYAWEPIFSECHCTETINQNQLNETTNRTTADHF